MCDNSVNEIKCPGIFDASASTPRMIIDNDASVDRQDTLIQDAATEAQYG